MTVWFIFIGRKRFSKLKFLAPTLDNADTLFVLVITLVYHQGEKRISTKYK